MVVVSESLPLKQMQETKPGTVGLFGLQQCLKTFTTFKAKLGL